MEATEIKAKLEEFGRAVKELNESVKEKVQAELKGEGLGEIKSKLSKINEAIDGFETMKKSIEALQTAANRRRSYDSKGDELPEDTAEAKASYSMFLRKGQLEAKGMETREFSYEKKSMSVVSDADGGYTVTADMSGRIIQKIFETSPIRDVASQVTIGTDAYEGMNDLQEASSGWVGETGSRAQTNAPQFGKWRIPVHEQYANPAITQKLLDDSNLNIEAWLAGKVADKFARVENTAFVLGTGQAQPKGFMTYAAGTGGTTAKQIQQVALQDAATIKVAGLIALQMALKDYYRSRAQWGMNRGTISVIRQMVDGFGRPLWEPSLQIGEPSRLLGMPINEFNDMSDVAGNSLPIICADWKEFYTIVDRAGVRVLRDPYTAKPYVLFYTTKRVGGDVLNFEAAAIGKISAS